MFGKFHGTLVVSDSVKCKLYLAQEVLLGGVRDLVEALSSPLYSDSIYIPFSLLVFDQYIIYTRSPS